MKFTARVATTLDKPDRMAAQFRKDLRAAAIIATDQVSKDAQQAIQRKIRGVGLGRLANAVGQTSLKKQRRGSSGNTPYGVIFARGGDESRGGQALESYSKGATIRAGPGKTWLAIPTKNVPKFVSLGGRRFRTTPELYRISGLVTRIGTLVFKPTGRPDRALLVIKNVSVSPKGGPAKALGSRGTRTRIAQKEVVAFVLILVTRRAARFDKDSIAGSYAGKMPTYMAAAMAEIQARRLG